MATIIKQQYGQKIDATGSIQVFHFETDSDMVLIEGESGVTLTAKLRALTANRTLSLTGGVTGSVTHNGVDNVEVEVEVTDDGHEHTGGTVKVGTAGRVVVTGTEGLLVSAVTADELGYLSGVTSAIQTQLNAKSGTGHNHDSVYLKQALLGANNGVVPLGSDGKILAQYLPSYVDDVVEGTASSDLTSFTDSEGNPAEMSSGKLYHDTTAGKVYRWGGSKLAEVGGGGGVALGETETTAYRGDRGKIAYDHSQAAHARTDATVVATSATNGNILINGVESKVYTHPGYTARSAGLYKITVDATGHISAVEAVTAADITGLGIPAQDTTYSEASATAAGLMSVASFNKLSGIAAGANAYTHPAYTTRSSGLYKITVDATGHVSAATAVVKADITGLGIPAQDNDTKNTAGSTNSSSKLFLIGATAQDTNPQTYSHDTAYVGADGHLYSNGVRVIGIATGSQPTNQAAGDLWFESIS